MFEITVSQGDYLPGESDDEGVVLEEDEESYNNYTVSDRKIVVGG